MHLTTLSRTFRSDDSSKTFSRPYSNSNYSSMQIHIHTYTLLMLPKWAFQLNRIKKNSNI